MRANRRYGIRPLAISHGANSLRTDRSRFLIEFDWTGTNDPSAFLAVPAALRFMESAVPGGWPEVMRRNRELALKARDILLDALSIEAPVPDALLGSMAAVPLPDGNSTTPAPALFGDPLQDRLLENHRIEVPVIPWPAPPNRLIRVSAQLYNEEVEYRLLATSLRAELDAEKP